MTDVGAAPALDWNLLLSALSLIVSTVTAVVIYRLGRRLDFRSRMDLRARLKLEAASLLTAAPSRTVAPEIILLNAQRYEREWDGTNSFSRQGWLQHRGEMIEVRHNGLEFIETAIETWRDTEGRLTLRKTPTEGPTVLKVGFLPFDRIEHIEPHGDEYRGSPNIYVKVGFWSRSPYSHYLYTDRDGYAVRDGGREHFAQRSELGITPLGLRHFWQEWGTATLLRDLRRFPRRPFVRSRSRSR